MNWDEVIYPNVIENGKKYRMYEIRGNTENRVELGIAIPTVDIMSNKRGSIRIGNMQSSVSNSAITVAKIGEHHNSTNLTEVRLLKRFINILSRRNISGQKALYYLAEPLVKYAYRSALSIYVSAKLVLQSTLLPKHYGTLALQKSYKPCVGHSSK